MDWKVAGRGSIRLCELLEPPADRIGDEVDVLPDVSVVIARDLHDPGIRGQGRPPRCVFRACSFRALDEGDRAVERTGMPAQERSDIGRPSARTEPILRVSEGAEGPSGGFQPSKEVAPAAGLEPPERIAVNLHPPPEIVSPGFPKAAEPVDEPAAKSRERRVEESQKRDRFALRTKNPRHLEGENSSHALA